jgi:protein-disulfide isomerase
VGRYAPPLELLTPDSVWINTASIKAPYTMMIFWDPTCGHCKEVMPKLAKVYEANKDKGWKVIALSSSDKKPEWIKYLAEHPEMKEFVHLLRGVVRTEEMAHNMQSYYVVTSPTIFILDKDKKILANRIDAEKIEEFIGHFEKEEPAKKK